MCLSSGNRAFLFLAKAHKLSFLGETAAMYQNGIKKPNEMEII